MARELPYQLPYLCSKPLLRALLRTPGTLLSGWRYRGEQLYWETIRSYWLRFGRQGGDPCIDFGQVRVVGVPRSFASVFTGHLPLDLSFGELAIG